MASVGHIAAGMAAARIHGHRSVPRWSSLLSWSALSLLPDVDVIGFALGVDYADAWGHRGASHSLAMSAAVGLAIGLAAPWFKRPMLATALIATCVLASHGILDAMTDGGLGCALFWPFDTSRYFLPWRPIPVAPIGPDFLSPEGGMIALTELVLFSPVLLFALRPPRLRVRPGPVVMFLAAWAASVWLISSGSEAREAIVGFVLREDTAYTTGFSEEAFRKIARGDSDDQVRRLLGPPMREDWLYSAGTQSFEPANERSVESLRGECALVRFEGGIVASTLDRDACTRRGIQTGMTFADVERRLGPPPERDWIYTWSARGGRHRLRMVYFTNTKVSMIVRQWKE